MLRKNLIVLAVLTAAAVLALSACGGSGSDAGSGGAVSATVEVVGGQPEGGLQTIEARKGDAITLTVESDTGGEAHVHGYDLEKEAGPGAPAVFGFEATLEGIFDIELHQGPDETKIAELRVNP